MPTFATDYELFNFIDPIEAAVQAVVQAAVPDLAVRLPRDTGTHDDIDCYLAIEEGDATGHVARVAVGPDPIEEHSVYDQFAGGRITLTLIRHRYDAETVASLDADDATARDTIGHYAGRLRHALRAADAKELNAALVSPKISYILPEATLREIDEETGADIYRIPWRINYGIPAEVLPRVILTEDGFRITTESGDALDIE
jgi:hypothetical protein